MKLLKQDINILFSLIQGDIHKLKVLFEILDSATVLEYIGNVLEMAFGFFRRCRRNK